MTTYTFTPSSTTPFQFQPTLDGSVYTGVVTWNLYGGRYYFNLYTAAGTRVYTCPLIGSPPDRPIILLPPLNPSTGLPWTSTLWFRQDAQTFVVTP